jgi:hypothetical protein
MRGEVVGVGIDGARWNLRGGGRGVVGGSRVGTCVAAARVSEPGGSPRGAGVAVFLALHLRISRPLRPAQ